MTMGSSPKRVDTNPDFAVISKSWLFVLIRVLPHSLVAPRTYTTGASFSGNCEICHCSNSLKIDVKSLRLEGTLVRIIDLKDCIT